MEKPHSKPRPWDQKRIVLRPMEERKRNSFYHTARWTRESRAFRQLHPICRECESEGLIVPTEVTDHIIPLEICEDPWDWNNWDGLCKRHNNIKAAKDKILIQQYRKSNPK
jgi:5-methylcytosine-specific restriction protein A